MAKATVLAEGTLAHLTLAAQDYYDLHGEDPQRWELGVKEVWEVNHRIVASIGVLVRTS